MKKQWIILMILAFALVLTSQLYAEELGRRGETGQLTITYPGNQIRAEVDGRRLNPRSGNDVTGNFPHGPHVLSVYRVQGGNSELLLETVLFIPGGWEMDVTIAAQGVMISRCEDSFNRQHPGHGNAGNSTQVGGTGGIATPEDRETEPMPQPGQRRPPRDRDNPNPPRNPNAIVTFMSPIGDCEVFIDGESQGTMGKPARNEMERIEINPILAGTYTVRVVSFGDVWYHGELTIGASEHVTVRITNREFTVVSRDPLE